MTSIQVDSVEDESNSLKKFAFGADKIRIQHKVLNELATEEQASFKKRTDRKSYLKDFGAQIKMPTTYLSTMKFYTPDTSYIVAFVKESMPAMGEKSVINFKKLGSKNFNSEEIFDKEYARNQMKKSACSHFKVYMKDENTALQVAERAAAPEYLANCAFSSNMQMIGLIKKSAEDEHGKRYIIIDLYNTESIDFFLSRQDQPVNTKDPDFYGSIHCTEVTTLEPNKLKIRFSKSNKYLFINQENTHLVVYELQNMDDYEIREPSYYLQIPEETSFIVNIAINEEDISYSLVACKKKDFRTVLVMPLSYIEDLNQKQMKRQRSFGELQDAQMIRTIRYASYNTESLDVKFSSNMQKLFLCTDQDFFIRDLLTNKQTILHFCEGKRVRKIFLFGVDGFVIATANDQDKYITFSHTDGDPLHQIQMTNRYDVGLVSFHDLIEEQKVSEKGAQDISLIIVRDDEEFMLMTYRNFSKLVFWSRILETSNYIFEWPYIVYVRNQKNIIIHSIYEEEMVYVIKGDDLGPNEFISHLFATYTYEIFFVIDTGSSYKVFQVNTQNIIKRRIHEVECASKAMSKTYFSEKTMKDNMMVDDQERELSFKVPIFEIQKQKALLDNLYRIIVRPSCRFEANKNNNETMVFFISNFRLFHVNAEGTTEIDRAYKYKQFNRKIGTYRPVDKNRMELNLIKLLHIDYSDYRTQTIYDSVDESIIEYQTDDPYFIILSQSYKGPILRLYKLFQTQLEMVSQTMIDNPNFIAVAQICSMVCGGMFLKGNQMYHLDYSHKQLHINHYKEVLPLNTAEGEQVQFNSPYFSKDDRKVLYFTKNTIKKSPRKAYVQNYIIDSFTVTNTRESDFIQYCFFIEYKKKNRWKVDSLTFAPQKKFLLQYSVFGKLRKIIFLDKLFQVFGDKILTFDDRGRSFAISRDEDCGVRFISKISILTNENLTERLSHVKTQRRIIANQIEEDNLAERIGKNLTEKIDTQIQNQEFDESEEHVEYEMEFRGVRNALLSPRQREDKQVLSSRVEISVTGEQKSEEGIVNFKHVFTIDLHDVEIHHEKYPKIRTVLMLLEHYKNSQFKKTSFKMNDNGDILIAIGNGKEKIDKILEVILIKQSDPTKGFFLTPEKEKIQKDDEEENNGKHSILQKLEAIKSKGNKQVTLFEGFQLTEDKVILWTEKQIYQQDTDCLDSVLYEIRLKKVAFALDKKSEGKISAIVSKGQKTFDKKAGNYYVIIKVIMPKNAFVMKYNLMKEKEFTSFEVSKDCQLLFDQDRDGYVFEKECLISVSQGLPLLFFQDKLDNYNQKLFLDSLDRGVCFSLDKELFMVRNKVVFSFSYLSLLTLHQNEGQPLTKENFSISAYNFRIDGQTILHKVSQDYNQLKMMLQSFKEEGSNFGNLLLLQDYNHKNALDLACEIGDQKVINLILDYLSKVKLNNINLVRKQMFQLIEYDSFDNFMDLCFFQTVEMQNRTLYNPKSFGDSLYISSYPTCFIDSSFDQKFQDKGSKTRPVKIKTIDAGWVFKKEEGMEFLQALAESQKMSLFLIPTIKYLIIYQWTKIYPVIRNRLFFPFLSAFLAIHFYFIYLYEWQVYVRESNAKPLEPGQEPEKIEVIFDGFKSLMICFKVVLGVLLGWQVYIEIMQIKLHSIKGYLTNFWNFFDFTSIIFLFLILIADFFKYDPLQVRPLMALTFVLFYFRMFYYLRIFDATAPLVKAIIEIAYDSIQFLLVFTIGICCFAFAFWTLSNNNVKLGTDFIHSFSGAMIYSYLLGLGEFGYDNFDGSQNAALIWCVFILASIFSLIILLNMLIAIMGETFTRVQENAESHFLREHLQLIIENEFLYDRQEMFGNVKYMIAIIDDNDAIQEDLWLEKIDQVVEKYSLKIEGMKEAQAKQDAKVDHIQSMQEKMKEEVFRIRELLEKRLP